MKNRNNKTLYKYFALAIFFCTSLSAQVITPVSIVSGYNQDIIANGVGNASASSTIGFDQHNSRALVSLDFQATGSSATPVYGLPVNGLINSLATAGVVFQLGNYSGNNALFLTPVYVGQGTDTGTLAFSAANVSSLYILAGAAGGGVQNLPFTATVNFSDATSQTQVLTVGDWYSGSNFALQGIGRINRTNNTLEGNATDPRLYEIALPLDAVNHNKTITGVTFSFDGDEGAEWSDEIRMSVLAISIVEAQASTPACTFSTLSLTGFNADAFAEGTGGNANAKVSTPIDAANAYYTQDFVPLNPHSSGASAAAYGGGFPNDGFIESSATEGLTFQIASYNGNNALLLRNSLTNTGTLTLVEQKKAEKIYLGWITAEGSNTVTVTVNFADGTSQVFANQTPVDWWSTNPNASILALGSVGRISVVTWAGWAPLNSFSGLTQAQLFQQEFLLDAANHDKLISSIGFVKATSANNAATTAILAVSICETGALGVNEIAERQLNIFPNPATEKIKINSHSPVNGVQVYNISGQLVLESIGDEINVQALASGNYIIQVRFEDNTILSRKIIKK